MSVHRATLEELRAFGREVHRAGDPSFGVAEGGFLVPVTRTPAHPSRRKEQPTDVKPGQRAEEARSPAGSREGSQAETAASDPAAHPFECILNERVRLDELREYFPDVRILGSSSNCLLLTLSASIFRTLPYRARLLLEVPLVRPATLRMFVPPGLFPRGTYGVRLDRVPVPDVRAWAFWGPGILVQAHHINPDRSICACMPHEWAWGRDSLLTYVGFCISWLGKVLHSELLGWWPGQQHHAPSVRLKRNAPAEFCGCGSSKLWDACCMERDRAVSPYGHFVSEARIRRSYLAELVSQGRSPGLPFC